MWEGRLCRHVLYVESTFACVQLVILVSLFSLVQQYTEVNQTKLTKLTSLTQVYLTTVRGNIQGKYGLVRKAHLRLVSLVSFVQFAVYFSLQSTWPARSRPTGSLSLVSKFSLVQSSLDQRLTSRLPAREHINKRRHREHINKRRRRDQRLTSELPEARRAS